MQSIFIEYVILILIILGLVMLADKLQIAYPIVLVIGGLAISFLGDFSNISIDPDLVFLILLPPLLYEAAWQVSWKEFWKWRRAIVGFAFPIVLINAFVIALFSSWLIPGFTLALGFLLGGIISPPDAVAATTIMRRVEVPKVIVTIAEGESLLNDASSLIIFRFALAAIITGQFYVSDAATNFILVVVFGVLIGLAVGVIFYLIHRFLPVTTSIEIVLSLVTPYCMYYAAENFHYSGVLAVVSGGLFLSSKRAKMLSYRTRIEAVNVWNSFIFVLNGIIFLIIGLQLPSVVSQLGEIGLATAIWYGLLISLVLIVTRMACTLGTSAFTVFMSRFVTVSDAHPGWKNPVITGWAGMRGVVSLGMALSIPLLINDSQPFPFRNLILFVTFVVILMTLVFQGLTLPWVIRNIGPEDKFTRIPEEDQEMIIQKKIALASTELLRDKYSEELENNPYVRNLYERLELDAEHFTGLLAEPAADQVNEAEALKPIYLDMLAKQRQRLNELNRLEEFNEDLIRKHIALIDVEELKVREMKFSRTELPT
ncbi:MAG: Na+/H+ antiporter [Pyrinomonadaceae bacterium]